MFVRTFNFSIWVFVHILSGSETYGWKGIESWGKSDIKCRKKRRQNKGTARGQSRIYFGSPWGVWNDSFRGSAEDSSRTKGRAAKRVVEAFDKSGIRRTICKRDVGR